MRERGIGVEKETWPIAMAVRWVGFLAVMEIWWTSEVALRWGRVGGGALVDSKRMGVGRRRWRGMRVYAVVAGL